MFGSFLESLFIRNFSFDNQKKWCLGVKIKGWWLLDELWGFVFDFGQVSEFCVCYGGLFDGVVFW